MELGVSHVQNLSSSTPIVDNIFDKYNKNLVPIRSLSDPESVNKMLQNGIEKSNFSNGPFSVIYILMKL